MEMSAVGEDMEVFFFKWCEKRILGSFTKTYFEHLLSHKVVDQHGVINIDAEDVGNPQLVSLVNIDISWHGKDD